MVDSRQDILFIYLQHEFKTENPSSSGSFDNTLIAELLDADVGMPLASSGEMLIDERDDALGAVLAMDDLADGGGFPKISSLYHPHFCVTDDATMSDQVRLTTGDVVDITDYDVLIVSHLWAYNHYIDYLAREFPEQTLIAIQEGSIQDVTRYSSGLQVQHRQVLDAVDGYITENREYDAYVRHFVDEVHSIPLLVPDGQFQNVSPRKKEDRICIGVTTWNVDMSNFYTNLLVVDALRRRGFDLTAELVGVKDFQGKMLAEFDDLPFVETVSYIEDGFYEYLSQYRLAVLLTSRATAGRVSAECAGVGVPVIGNQENDLQRRCYPDLSIGSYDITEAVSLGERLLTDEDFYEETVARASETVSSLQDHRRVATELREFVSRVHN